MTAPPHGVAARATLCQYFTSILQGASVEATPCLSHAAVASNLIARCLSDNTTMEPADWAAVQTMYAM